MSFMTDLAPRHLRPWQNRLSLAVSFVGTDLFLGGSAIDLMSLPNSIKLGYARFFSVDPQRAVARVSFRAG